jgi:hypothetical protein
MKGKVNMKPARALFHILRYVSMMDLYPLHHLLTGLVLKKTSKKIIKGHDLTFKLTESPFLSAIKTKKSYTSFTEMSFLT